MDVMAVPAPPDPIAPVISPPLTSEERRDNYQKPKGDDGDNTFVYHPENPKTPPRKTRRWSTKAEKPDSSEDKFTETVKKNDDKAGFGSNGSIFVDWKIQMLPNAPSNKVFSTLPFEDHLQSVLYNNPRNTFHRIKRHF